MTHAAHDLCTANHVPTAHRHVPRMPLQDDLLSREAHAAPSPPLASTSSPGVCSQRHPHTAWSGHGGRGRPPGRCSGPARYLGPCVPQHRCTLNVEGEVHLREAGWLSCAGECICTSCPIQDRLASRSPYGSMYCRCLGNWLCKPTPHLCSWTFPTPCLQLKKVACKPTPHYGVLLGTA